MSIYQTTRYPNGVVNSHAQEDSGSYTVFDKTKHHEIFDDFNNYFSGTWKETASGSSTIGLVNGNGGILSVANPVTSSATTVLQYAGGNASAIGSFLVQKSSDAFKLLFKSTIKLSNVLQSGLLLGLANVGAGFSGVTDGIYFQKSVGSTILNLIIVKDSTATTIANINPSVTLANNTFYTLAFYFDGNQILKCFVNNNTFNVSDVFDQTNLANLPTTVLLTPTIAVQNGTAGAVTLSVDNVWATQETFISSY